MPLFGPQIQSVRYFIMQKVHGKWKTVYTGKVPINKEFFSKGNSKYHVDMSKVQKDSGGNECLKYDIGYFEPMTRKMDATPTAGEELAPHGSAESNQLLAREGWVAHVMRAVNAQSVLNSFVIMMLVGAGLMGYFGGNALPINTLLGHPSVGGYVTITVANTTISSGNASATTTVTKASLIQITATQYIAVTTTSTLSTYTASYYLSTTTTETSVSTTLSTTTVPTTITSTLTETLPGSTTTVTTTNSATVTVTHTQSGTNSTITQTTTLPVTTETTTKTISVTTTVPATNSTVTVTTTVTST